MLVQLWPNVNTYLRDMIKSTIEPKIQETLTLYKMTGFQFDRLRFGTIVRVCFILSFVYIDILI